MKGRLRREMLKHGIPMDAIGLVSDWRERKSLRDSWFTLGPKLLRRHCWIIGATGSGKTTGMHQVIANDIRRGHSFVLLDQRGDLANSCLELLARSVYVRDSLFFDLREQDRPTPFNPLAGAGEPYFRALGTLDAIRAQHDSWGVQIQEVFLKALLALASSGGSLVDLEPFLIDARFRRQILSRVQDDRLIEYWRTYGALSPERQALLSSPVLNKVSGLVALPNLRKMFGHPQPIDLASYLNRPGTAVLTSLGVDQLGSLGLTVGSFLLDAIFRTVFSRVDIPESRRNPLRVFVDEFEAFPEAEFEAVLSESRRYSMSIILAHQAIAQISSRMRSLLLGNVGVIIAFRVSRDDSAFLSKAMTGDPKALDLFDLPVGTCMVAVQGQEPVLVEANAPIIKDPGRMSPEARQYREWLRQLVPPFDPQPDPPVVSEDESSEPSLEDWL